LNGKVEHIDVIKVSRAHTYFLALALVLVSGLHNWFALGGKDPA